MTKPVRYYVYVLRDADNVPRYVGKRRGRRVAYHEAKVRALLANPKTKRATRVHRLMLKDGRTFNPEIVAEELTQPEAYELEAELIRHYRGISEGGTLWNILSGGVERYPTRRLVRRRGASERDEGSGRSSLAGLPRVPATHA